MGLIEACKGIHELYHSTQSVSNAAAMPTSDRSGSSSSGSSGSGSGSSSGVEEEYAHAYHALRQMIAEVMDAYSSCICAAFRTFFRRYEDNALQESVDYADLTDLKGDATHELKAVLQNIQQLAGNADGAAATTEVKVSGDTADGDDNAQSAQFQSKATELQQEKSAWLLLARQAIVDVQFLDHNQQECFKKLAPRFAASPPKQAHPDLSMLSAGPRLLSRNAAAVVSASPHEHAATAAAAAAGALSGASSRSKLETHLSNSGKATEGDSCTSHVPKFANLLLHTLRAHADVLQTHRVSCYLRSVCSAVPYYFALLRVKDSCLNANNSTSGAHSSSSAPARSSFDVSLDEDDEDDHGSASNQQRQQPSAYQLARETSAKRMSLGAQGGLGGSIHGLGGNMRQPIT